MPLFRKKHSQGTVLPPASPCVRKTSVISEELSCQETLVSSEEERAAIFSYLGLNTLYSETPLVRTLTSPATQCHFVDYCKMNGAHNLVRFWLDVHSLRGCTASTPVRSVCAPSPASDSSQETSSRSLDSGLELHDDDGEESRNGNRSNVEAMVKRDAVDIYQKFFAPDCKLSLAEFVDINMTRRVVENICTVSGQVDPGCFDEVHAHVERLLDQQFFQPYVGSVHYARQQLELLSDPASMCLGTVLGDETLSMHLAEFAEASGFTHLLEFIVAAVHFRHQAALQLSKESSATENVSGDAMVLYEKYIALSGSSRLGLSDNLRSAVENQLRSTDVSVDIFDNAIVTSGKVVQHHFLPSFLSSPHLRQYVSEMNAYIKSDKSNSVKGSESNQSLASNSSKLSSVPENTESNEHTSSNDISTHNTLLASASKPKIGTVRAQSNSLLLNWWDQPDALWRRTHHCVINIGRIDNFGRYQSLIEPAPVQCNSHSNSGKRIGTKMAKVVKKLVSHSDEFDSVQNEMAWQVARSVLKDVENDLRMSSNSETVLHERKMSIAH